MVASVSGGGSSALLAAMMKDVASRQALEVAMVKKAQDVEKMQGEAVLELIDAAATVAEPGGIDVRA